MFIETFDEFQIRMACAFLILPRDQIRDVVNRYLFSNGATSDGANDHRDPPEDDYTRLNLKKKFLRVRRDRLNRQLQEGKRSVNDQIQMMKKYPGNAGVMMAPGPEDLAALRALKAKVNIIDKKLRLNQAAIERTPEGKQAAESRRFDLMMASRRHEQLQQAQAELERL